MPYADTSALTSVLEADQATLLDLAASAVDTYIGRTLVETEYIETFSDAAPQRGGDRIWLVPPDWPATVSEIIEDGTSLTEDDYTVRDDGGLIRDGGDWDGDVTVTYTTGFPAGSVEMGTAKRIVLEVAARAAANPQGLDSLTADGVAPSFVSRDNNLALPPVSLTKSQRDELWPLRWKRVWV